MTDSCDSNFDAASERIVDAYGTSGQPQDIIVIGGSVDPHDDEDLWAPTPALLKAEYELVLLRMNDEMQKRRQEMMFPIEHRIMDSSL